MRQRGASVVESPLEQKSGKLLHKSAHVVPASSRIIMIIWLSDKSMGLLGLIMWSCFLEDRGFKIRSQNQIMGEKSSFLWLVVNVLRSQAFTAHTLLQKSYANHQSWLLCPRLEFRKRLLQCARAQIFLHLGKNNKNIVRQHLKELIRSTAWSLNPEVRFVHAM